MHFGEHVCVVALGITIDGVKVPLAIEEGSTENATLVTSLIVGLRDRGLDVTRPILAVLDGSRALARAVKDVFDYPVIARCQQHKIRNVRDRLPDKLRPVVERRMRQAYHAESALAAQAQLEALAGQLDKTHPGAAASLREGLEETLTMLRLGVPPTLARSLRSTNPIESMIEICREHAKTVEIQRRGVSWLPDLWGIDGSDRPVWRLEFQYRRAVLAEFNLSGVDETVASVQDLWRYGTEEWMSLRVRRKHSVRRRWPVDPLW